MSLLILIVTLRVSCTGGAGGFRKKRQIDVMDVMDAAPNSKLSFCDKKKTKPDEEL